MSDETKPKRRVGRPLKFASVEEFNQKADAYFTECVEKNRPITITGLAYALDTSRETLMDYEDDRGEEFSDAVKRAKVRCQVYAEEQAFVGKNAGGAIFVLKNHGWRDQQHLDVETQGEKVTSLNYIVPGNQPPAHA